MSGLTITVTNESTVEFTRNVWADGVGSTSGMGDDDSLTNTPSLVLSPGDGMTTAAAHQTSLEGITQNCLWIQLGYHAASIPNSSFGVLLQQNLQEFSIGKGDTWQYFNNGDWVNAGENSSQKIWTFGKVTVTATPTLDHQSASCAILITGG